MIKGMTGYGTTDFTSHRMKGSVEIKSQNHRYFDLVFYLPSGFSLWEEKVRQIVGREIKRGRVILSFKITTRPQERYVFNKDTIREYLKQARALRKEFNIEDDIGLSDLMKLPGVIESKEISIDLNHFWPSFEKALRQTLKSCLNMRQREGRSLDADLRAITSKMISSVKAIQRQAHAIIAANKKVLTPDEFLSFAKGNDISEELARLKHYIEEFRRLLKTKVSVGKKMDFVAQEMQRETNTIGSKIQDAVIANAVISLKSHIEKLREQAQNIE